MKLDKKVTGLLIAVALVLFSRLMPVSGTLTREALTAMMLFLSAIVMWITESLPVSVTGIGAAMLMVLFGCYSLNDSMHSFAGTGFFFVFGSYAINACLAETTIPDRICAFFIRLAKGKSRMFVLGIMAATALISSIMSNMVTCALMATPAVKLLEMNRSGKDSKLGRCLMIGVPLACGAGGFATPAGTPSNVIAINLLEQNLGITIRFIDWMIVGVPLAILSVLVCAFSITLVFKPEKLSEETVAYASSVHQTLGSLNIREKKTIGVIGTEIVLWLLGTWVPILNTTLVALLMMVVMFLPGVSILDWKMYNKYANYNVLFMMGAITALVGGLQISGGTAWLVNSLIPDMHAFSPFLVYLIVSALVAVFHMLIPAGTAVLTFASVPVLAIAAGTGLNGAALMLIASFWAGATFLLPFDAVPLLTYSKGYYKVTDMTRAGVIPYLILIPSVAYLAWGLCSLFGL